MAMPIPDATRTLPTDWKYISEGGATIVFSYVGPDNTDFNGMVLRLRKLDNQTMSSGEVVTTESEEPDDPSISFQHVCMERLIPPVHLPRLGPVTVSPAWLATFADFHNSERPASRINQGGIDTTRRKGVIATDLVGRKGISVEIKPKWAFLPNTSYMDKQHQVIKSRTCRGCMRSTMRSLNGETATANYCPLDLFSSDATRVRRAVHALYDAWLASDGKVNNLKVFIDGTKIRVEDRRKMLRNSSPEISDQELCELFADSIIPCLTQTPVLRILSRLQRTLDVLDIDGLSKLWKQHHRDSSVIGSGINDPTLTEWSTFIDGYLNAAGKFNPESTDLRHYLFAYLLSATFKDCSIIIRMEPLGADVVVDPSKVTVIDLGPKSMSRMNKWKNLDSQIIQAYQSIAEEQRKSCVDDWIDDIVEAGSS